MQEIKKRRILLASVLKPVDEPRAFEKIGQSLASAGYEVFIAGAPASAQQTVDSITFLPHPKVNRISLSRIITRVQILSSVFRVKPDVLIICTHELLGIAVIYRLLTGKKIIYDVQENYFANILYTHAFPAFTKRVIASIVRFKEVLASIFFSGFILAEQCYQHELSFVKKNCIVIENKCKLPLDFRRKEKEGSIRLIFTGTLAESTGVLEAIDFAKKLHALESKVELRIVGFSPLSSILQRINDEIQRHSFISLKGGDHFVSHADILEEIASADFGLISYPILPHTKERIPTKLYEYMACGLPFFLEENSSWVQACASFPHAFAISFQHADYNKTLETVKQRYAGKGREEALWQCEEPKLLSFLDAIQRG
jgi:glycosyltransferase involved in cell wall biosynthesis